MHQLTTFLTQIDLPVLSIKQAPVVIFLCFYSQYTKVREMDLLPSSNSVIFYVNQWFVFVPVLPYRITDPLPSW